MFFDSHAHIDFDKFDQDRDEVINRASDAGVKHIIQIAMGPEEENFKRCYKIVENNPNYFMAAGLHPHDADRYTEQARETIRTYLKKERVIALGEIGLDYYYDNSDRDNQKNAFSKLMDLAIEEKKPICIHTREAFEDTKNLTMEKDIFQKVGGVIHCFTGTKSQALAFVEQGAYISFSGVVTFKNTIEIQEAAKAVPLNKILIETDCPFLAPTPYRGKRNEPAYVVEVAKTIAALKGLSIEEVAESTTHNCKTLFKIDNFLNF